MGTAKTIDLGFHPVIAAIMGMFTAVMGGVLRDTLINETPVLFKRDLCNSMFGGRYFVLDTDQLEIERNINFIISGVLIVVIRLLAVYYKWSVLNLDDMIKLTDKNIWSVDWMMKMAS